MPDPFRHYEGTPVLDLPADAPAPSLSMLSVLNGEPGSPLCKDGASFLSSLLFHSASISATKIVPSTGYRYALRVNPSSGNLHPTEFHFAARGLSGWPDGLYHYRASSHMAEQRQTGGDAVRELLNLASAPAPRDCPLLFVLTSIAWREAWKYRDRAYRYCLHDIGHAWASLALAARALGAPASAFTHFPDEAVARSIGVHDEWPMLLVALCPPGLSENRQAAGKHWIGGAANALSPVVEPYPAIDDVHAATRLLSFSPVAQASAAVHRPGNIALAPIASSDLPFAEAVRRRRSALDFRGGSETISLEMFSRLLHAAARPFAADFEGDLQGPAPAHYITLYAYVHRVDGLDAGVYRVCPVSQTIHRIGIGDQRLMAAGLSLGQDLAGNSCVTFSMVASMQRALADHGERGYRYVFFEAGHIGQRLYLASEAMGFRSTGIGAFYDDSVHRYLGLDGEHDQVVYHFACGFPVHDPRLEC
ncbi:MAG: SagB/ThcOx family dehydrogenase [Bryobacterales bacterium]|nr:SagB/ThcOx family dehydrogenase [Bryobacterales bacterium]